MNMIDQVAIAVAEASSGNSRRFVELFKQNGPAIARMVARVAINAMREPTPAMIEAAVEWLDHDGIRTEEQKKLAAGVFRAMIIAAEEDHDGTRYHPPIGRPGFR